MIQEALNGTNYQSLLESTDYQVGLRNLVEVVNQLDEIDYENAVNDNNLLSEFDIVKLTAESFLKGIITYEKPMELWKTLREKYENIIVDVDENSSPLSKEIFACETLNRADYTQASWAELQACLQKAYQVTEHNLSISNVRRALENARQNLCEEGIEKQLVRLQVWLSVCDDLVPENYKTGTYDQLNIQLILINGKQDELVTKDAINTVLAGLQTSYTNLEREKDVPNYGSKLFNINLIQYFIVTAILFTGAVVVGSISGFLKRRAR